MRMTFGMYRGIDLTDVPDDYLVWVLSNVETLDSILRDAIRARLGLTPTSSPGGPVATDVRRLAETVRDAIRVVYRETAARFHPDHGGTNEAMIAVNHMYERLDETLSQRLREIGGR